LHQNWSTIIAQNWSTIIVQNWSTIYNCTKLKHYNCTKSKHCKWTKLKRYSCKKLKQYNCTKTMPVCEHRNSTNCKWTWLDTLVHSNSRIFKGLCIQRNPVPCHPIVCYSCRMVWYDLKWNVARTAKRWKIRQLHT